MACLFEHKGGKKDGEDWPDNKVPMLCHVACWCTMSDVHLWACLQSVDRWEKQFDALDTGACVMFVSCFEQSAAF